MSRKYMTLQEFRDATGLSAVELRKLMERGIIRPAEGKRSGTRIARTELRKLDGLVLTQIPAE